ncbi:MAG: ArsR family transcriptional regulator [Thermoguttaceae bacterium]|jgi:predicted ArsR family transcriptional regulator
MPEARINAAGLRVVKLLVGNPPQTVESLIRATGVTRTAVAEQLHALLAAGFVERTVEKLEGRGRPRHRFAAKRAALASLLADNQPPVVPAIWQAIHELGGDDLLKKVLQRVARLLANHYAASITAKDPKERVQQLVKLFESEGALVELCRSDGRLVIRRRSCPFINIADEKRNVCAIDLDLLSAVAGRRIRRIASRLDGSPSCIFEVERER